MSDSSQALLHIQSTEVTCSTSHANSEKCRHRILCGQDRDKMPPGEVQGCPTCATGPPDSLRECPHRSGRPGEKGAARRAFNLAFHREVGAVIQESKERAARIEGPSELWELEGWLSSSAATSTANTTSATTSSRSCSLCCSTRAACAKRTSTVSDRTNSTTSVGKWPQESCVLTCARSHTGSFSRHCESGSAAPQGSAWILTPGVGPIPGQRARRPQGTGANGAEASSSRQ